MYQYLTLTDDLSNNHKETFNEIYPRKYSEVSFFLHNTKCYHDLDAWHHEKRMKAKKFFKNYQLTIEHYETILTALNNSETILRKKISLKGKIYTKIIQKKIDKKQIAFYFKPLKIYLTN